MTLLLPDVPTFLLLGSIAPPTLMTSSPFFISETLARIRIKAVSWNERESGSTIVSNKIQINGQIAESAPVELSVLVLEVVPLVRVRLHGEGEEVEAGEVGDEDGVPAVPPIVSISDLFKKKNYCTMSPITHKYRVLKKYS